MTDATAIDSSPAGPVAAGVAPLVAGFTLTPPPGFTPATGFRGFEHGGFGASFVLTELPPGSSAEIARLTPGELEARGLAYEGRETFPTGTGEGLVLTAVQEAHGALYDKWLLVVEGPASTWLVTVNRPVAARDAVSAIAVREALASVAPLPSAASVTPAA